MMTRRAALAMLGGTALGADKTVLTIGGATLDVSFEGAAFDLSNSELVRWVTRAAEAVTVYYGKFPVPRARIRVVVTDSERGVSNGRSFGDGGAMCRITLGRRTSRSALERDWMLTHEMVHFGFPSVEENHHWIEEGSATYVEPIARVRGGQLTPRFVWNEVVRDLPQGLPETGDEGLDHTDTWGRTYWGGALFCLLADVGIRRKTTNQKGLEHALRGINQAGGTIDVDWPLEKAFQIGDRATGTKTLMDLYGQMRAKPFPVDLPGLWKELGIRRQSDAVTFDDTAPLAAIRTKIMTG
jgi:hypothetical protein